MSGVLTPLGLTNALRVHDQEDFREQPSCLLQTTPWYLSSSPGAMNNWIRALRHWVAEALDYLSVTNLTLQHECSYLWMDSNITPLDVHLHKQHKETKGTGRWWPPSSTYSWPSRYRTRALPNTLPPDTPTCIIIT